MFEFLINSRSKWKNRLFQYISYKER